MPQIQDGILEKFRGNKSFSWNDIHKEEFFKSIHENYFEVENNVKALIANDFLQ
jgi:hypothetical protein